MHKTSKNVLDHGNNNVTMIIPRSNLSNLVFFTYYDLTHFNECSHTLIESQYSIVADSSKVAQLISISARLSFTPEVFRMTGQTRSYLSETILGI